MAKTSSNKDNYTDNIIKQAKWMQENKFIDRETYRIKQQLKKKKK